PKRCATAAAAVVGWSSAAKDESGRVEARRYRQPDGWGPQACVPLFKGVASAWRAGSGKASAIGDKRGGQLISRIRWKSLKAPTMFDTTQQDSHWHASPCSSKSSMQATTRS